MFLFFRFNGVHGDRTSCGSKSKKNMFLFHASFLFHALEGGSNHEHHKRNAISPIEIVFFFIFETVS